MLVQIPVTVTDPQNRFVVGLEKENFRVFEDRVEQEVSHFSNEDTPLAVGLVFDTSGSMGEKLAIAKDAAIAFLKTTNPDDEFFLVTFADRPKMEVELTSDAIDIQNRLVFTLSKGRTALVDAIYLALQTMKRATIPRKALLIISDGGDNNSRYTMRDLKNLVREVDVQMYAIGTFERYRGGTPEEVAGPGLVSEICEQTGGRLFPAQNARELPDIAEKIGFELRSQYVLSYTPTNPTRNGKYRRVKVQLVPPRGLPQMRAFWRQGYYGPTQ